MFKKGDLVKFECTNKDMSNAWFIIWYLVTQDSQDDWGTGVVVKVLCGSVYEDRLVRRIGDIETFRDAEVTKEISWDVVIST
jgi:hypothetical protein